jgi:hypothetical protein
MATTKTKLIALVAMTTIRHNGETFESGDVLEVDETSAARLVASNSASTERVAEARAAAKARQEAADKAHAKAEADAEAARQAQAEADAQAAAEAEAASKLAAGEKPKKPGKT